MNRYKIRDEPVTAVDDVSVKSYPLLHERV
jgi:hypothetical protein